MKFEMAEHCLFDGIAANKAQMAPMTEEDRLVAHLIPNPILKVLSTLSCHGVRHLLMGGQACVLYGAAEFSRDCDIVILADESNLGRLHSALTELQARCIAFPEFKIDYLRRGHAVQMVDVASAATEKCPISIGR